MLPPGLALTLAGAIVTPAVTAMLCVAAFPTKSTTGTTSLTPPVAPAEVEGREAHVAGGLPHGTDADQRGVRCASTSRDGGEARRALAGRLHDAGQPRCDSRSRREDS